MPEEMTQCPNRTSYKRLEISHTVNKSDEHKYINTWIIYIYTYIHHKLICIVIVIVYVIVIVTLLVMYARLCVLILVGMVKQPTAEQTEFQMSSEDFPALPGTQLSDGILTSAASQGMTINHNAGRFFFGFSTHCSTYN